MKLTALLLPQAIAAAAIFPRQTPSNGGQAYSGWSAPDETYDGNTVLGTFDASSNTNNDSAPGLTIVDSSNGSQTSQGSRYLNITLQNLTPSLSFQDVFAVVHSDDVRLLDVGKPASDELASFITDGSTGGFSSLNMDDVYGTVAASSSSIAPGQYYNISVPLSLTDDVQDESTADALDDLDASVTIVGRFSDVDGMFFAVNAMDVGDSVESGHAAAYTVSSGFLTYHSGIINDTASVYAGRVVNVITAARNDDGNDDDDDDDDDDDRR